MDAYPVLNSNGKGHFGGAQVQQVLIAKELLKKGWKIDFITGNAHQPDNETINGIKILKAYNPNAGVKFLRFFFPRLFGTWKAMREADSEIYYQRSAGFLTGVVGVFCKLCRKKFIFATSSDFNVDKGFSSTGKKRDTVFYHLGLKLADRIIVQSRYQQRLLELNYGLFSDIIPNSIEISNSPEIDDKKEYILWVGNLYRLKQPELFVKLASKLPAHKFVIIGSMKEEEAYQQHIKNIINENPNVSFVGPVSQNDILGFYDKAYCLVNTSKYEGFSNTFLEAWSRNTPVISMNSDPDGIIAEFDLGFVVNSFNELVEKTTRFIEDDKVRKEMGNNGYSYVLNKFNIDNIAEKYDDFIKPLLSNP